MNEEVRWIKASVNKHFYDILNPLSIKQFLEGYIHDVTGLKEWCEIRFDGPHALTKRISSIKYDVLINAIGLSVIDMRNIFSHDNLIGNLRLCFTNCITVYKYGNAVGGDISPEIFGYLKRQEEIRLFNFSQPNESTEILQSALEADYKLETI